MYTYIDMVFEEISRSAQFSVSVKIAAVIWGMSCHQLLSPILDFPLQHCSFGACLQQQFALIGYRFTSQSSDQRLKYVSFLQK